jgi:hypothetical protein
MALTQVNAARKGNAPRNSGEGLVYFTTITCCDGRGDVPVASGVLCVPPSPNATSANDFLTIRY